MSYPIAELWRTSISITRWLIPRRRRRPWLSAKSVICAVAKSTKTYWKRFSQDRIHLGLPGRQQEMLEALQRTGKPLIVVLTTGSAVDLRWAERVSLQPGEERRLRFQITPDRLEIYTDEGSPFIEPGEFKVYVGGGQPDDPRVNIQSACFNVIA